MKEQPSWVNKTRTKVNQVDARYAADSADRFAARKTDPHKWLKPKPEQGADNGRS